MKSNKVTPGTPPAKELLSYKEKTDMFKLVFRNYLSLISVTDRKAGILIHVNTLIISAVVAFGIRYTGSRPFFIIPAICLLVVAIGTVTFSILASRPLERPVGKDDFDYAENLFFGSFDRVDNSIAKISWKEFEQRIDCVLNDEREKMFVHIKHEAFAVRKVLSQKFRYISVAYKIFLYGLLFSISCFIIACLLQYQLHQ